MTAEPQQGADVALTIGGAPSSPEPQTVNIPGVGAVRFPGSMSDDEIAAAAGRLHAEAQAKAKAAADGPMDLIAGAASAVNPAPVVWAAMQALPLPTALGGGGVPLPEAVGGSGLSAGTVQVPKGILEAQRVPMAKAVDAFQQGNYPEAARHALGWLLPLIGPVIDEAVDKVQQGQPWRGAGELLGTALGFKLPALVGGALNRAKLKVPGFGENPNVIERDAVQAGQAEGVNVPGGAVTGNRFVKSAQALTDHSPLGSFIAEKAAAETAGQMQAYGGRLADQVHPSPVTKVEAGRSTTKAVGDLVGQLETDIAAEYGKLDRMAADPANTSIVPAKRPAIEQAQFAQRSSRSLGRVPTDAEVSELRKISAELDNWQYTDETWTATADKSGNRAGGDYEASGGGGGDPVFRDIMQIIERYQKVQEDPASHVPRDAMSRGDLKRAIDSAVETGHFTNGAKAALDLARARVLGKVGRFESGRGTLPTGAGDLPGVPVAMAVDLGAAKPALRPIFEELTTQRDLSPAMMVGDKARAFQAIHDLLNGADHAPLSAVDALLSDMKSYAFNKAVRMTPGKLKLIQTIRALDAQVKAAARRVPGGLEALEAGRSMTTAKYAVIDILDRIRTEPGEAFRQMTKGGDLSIAHLNKIKELAPGEVAKIGRAILDDMLERAFQHGGSKHATQLLNEWDKIGKETREVLYGPIAPSLTKFFRLNEILSRSANPSMSGLVGGVAANLAYLFHDPIHGAPLILTEAAISKLLHSKAGVEALTRGLELKAGRTPIKGVAVQAARANLIRIAREQGIGLQGAPASADREAPGGSH